MANLRGLKAHETCCEKNPHAGLTPSDANAKTRVLCQQCGKSFLNQTSLKTHVSLIHGQTTPPSTLVAAPVSAPKKSPSLFCVTCHKSFSNKTVLDSHIRMVHFNPDNVLRECWRLSIPFPSFALDLDHIINCSIRFIWEKKKSPSPALIAERTTPCVL